MKEPNRCKHCNAPDLCLIACPFNKELAGMPRPECLVLMDGLEDSTVFEVVFEPSDSPTTNTNRDI